MCRCPQRRLGSTRRHTRATPHRLQSVADVEGEHYWRRLCPTLHVNDERFVNETKARLRSLMARRLAGEGESRESSLRGDMLADGYFKVRTFSKEITHARPIGPHTTRQLQMPGVEWPFRVSLLAEAVATLVRFGWHPVWVIMYDEAWLMAYAVHLLMRQVVNCDLQFNADFWAWYIDPVLQEKGWEPHRDRQTMPFNDRGEPAYVTAWIPFTDATPENGCIYVVPALFDEDYASGKESTDFDVQNVRALPAAAGRATVPRIALSMAFSTSDFEDPWLRLAAHGDHNDDDDDEAEPIPNNRDKSDDDADGQKRMKAGGQETCDAIPPPSVRSRLSVVATQHHLYEAQVAIPPHIAHILHNLEDPPST
ncbi:uncharacterized protein ACA1_075190 [Acanthamoeba castellanii str. Neff]|uniref:Uncharacterized protein n=1 Tax=Acanthamoeba castellanii (strain ATCC 30010 / Neff) TaxID=1257118 RepID=L8HHM2_ACACF|nr:uncharacterized protein ACA1_075190 [Acanthamoeba castellanii str. Neff]ELR23941.1 hypothetical protein ACA1_075190 [Acanthamoeba castellanii str. Neff]